MSSLAISYLVFGILLLIALAFDLGLLSKKQTAVTIRKALYQTIFWVGLAFTFFGFLYFRYGNITALEYASAYLMEWSLSIDNIFLFILIFTFFRIRVQYYGRVLLAGILMAIVFRIIFISTGIYLVEKFNWVLYIFGGILLFTGINMFITKNKGAVELEENRVYKLMKKIFPITSDESHGKLTLIKNGRKYYTNIFVVIVLLASTDIVFALDSIPAVFAISRNHLVIYTSNIFAVLGLRSLFFLLRGAVDRFSYLQQGIAIVLIFIGLKMLVEFFNIHIHVFISLIVILACIGSSIIFSLFVTSKNNRSKGPPSNSSH